MTNVGRVRTLDRRVAIQTALAQKPQIATARAEEAAAEAQTRQARAARMPAAFWYCAAPVDRCAEQL